MRSTVHRRYASVLVAAALTMSGGLVVITNSRAATAVSPFLRPDDYRDQTTALVQTMDIVDRRRIMPIGPGSPLVCKRLGSQFTTLRVAANPCALQLPSGDKDFSRPSWTKLDPQTNFNLVKSWAFWQFWAVRAPNATLENSPDAQIRALVSKMSQQWRTPNTRDPDPMYPVRNPPADVAEFIEAGWQIYGTQVLAIIARGEFEIDKAVFDFNNDGKPDQVYRLTRLSFGFNREPIDRRPTLQACHRSSSDDPKFTMGFFISENDDPKLSRSVIENERLRIYDTFIFQDKAHSVSRPLDQDKTSDIGWVSRNDPTTYLPTSIRSSVPDSGQPGVTLASVCQFNLSGVQP